MIFILSLLTIFFWFVFYFYYQVLLLYHIYIFFFILSLFLMSFLSVKLNIISFVVWKSFFLIFFWNICFFFIYSYCSVWILMFLRQIQVIYTFVYTNTFINIELFFLFYFNLRWWPK